LKVDKPSLRGYSHQITFFVALFISGYLLTISNSSVQYVATITYSLSALFLFGISSIYHRINWAPEKRIIVRRLDHAAIYIMIAGTSTPVLLLALAPEVGHKFLISIWAVVFVGVLQSVFFVNLSKKISSILYVITGYSVLPFLPELMKSFSYENKFLLFSGGAAYTIGALCYALKKPVLDPKVFGYHEVFHLLIILGAGLHYRMILSLIV
jgi:hemolysin III